MHGRQIANFHGAGLPILQGLGTGKPEFIGGLESCSGDRMPNVRFVLLLMSLVIVFGATPLFAEDSFEAAAEQYRESNWQAAANLFQEVANTSQNARVRVAALFFAGESFMQLGQYESAGQAFESLAHNSVDNPYYPRSLFRAGETALFGGNREAAEQFLKKFVQTQPASDLRATALVYLADIAFERRNHQQAIAAYSAVIDSQPTESCASAARLGLARALLAAKRPQEVSIALADLCDSARTSLALQALLLRGQAEYETDQFTEALETFRDAAKLRGDCAATDRAHLAAGWCLWQLDRCEEIPQELALLTTDSALESERKYLLGMTAYRTKEWTAAIPFLTRALEQRDAGHRSTALYYLGECNLRLHERKQARQWFEQLLREHADSPWADDALWGLTRAANSTDRADTFKSVMDSLRRLYPSSPYLRYAEAAPETMLSSSVSLEQVAEAATFEQAVGLERDGYLDAALAAYQKFLDQERHTSLHAEALWRAAQLNQRMSRSEDALSLLEELKSTYSQFDRMPALLENLAALKHSTGAEDQCQQIRRELLEKFPQSPQAAVAAYWLALAAADEQDSTTALKHLAWILNQLDTAENTESEVNRQLLDQALCLKCQLLANLGAWPEIVTLTKRASTDDERSPLAARLAYWQAEAEFRTHDYAVAKQGFEKLAVLVVGLNEPWVPMVGLRQAQLAARRQQWGRVLEFVRELEQSYPEFELAYECAYLRGRALAGRGEMTVARRAYQEVLQNGLAAGTETSAMAQWMIGETYFHQGDYEQAAIAYERVMEHDSYPQWQARAALQAGKCAELQEDWQRAAAIYANALNRWEESTVRDSLTARLRWAQQQDARQATPLLR